MTDLPVSPRHPSGADDSAGHGASAADNSALVEEMGSTVAVDEPSFSIVLDESAEVFVATKDDVEFGWAVFTEKDDRVILRATSIAPEFRGMGYATALTRRVLDLLYAEGKHVTVVCPVFRSFVQHNPEYANRLDRHPERDDDPGQ